MEGVATGQAATLIVVEDEPVTRALLGGSLRSAGFRVACLESAGELRRYVGLDEVDLVLLDIELPDGDGYGLAKWLRARSEMGIIFVSRRTAPIDRTRGLELGGDDFIVKPPDLDELLARVRAVLRRRGFGGHGGPGGRVTPPGGTRPPMIRPTQVLHFDGWTFDGSRFEIVSPSGQVHALTQGEASVLGAIAGARGCVVERAVLNEVLGGDGGAVNVRSLDVLVHRLRRKLGEGGSVVPRVLLTVHGVGYRLGVEVTAST